MLDKDTMEKYAKQIDYHLMSLANIIEPLRDAKTSLEKLCMAQNEKLLAEVKKANENYARLVRYLERMGMPRIDTYEMQLSYIREKLADQNWPIAIDTDALQTSKDEEANLILDFIVTEYLEGLSFMHYKCGTGHVVQKAVERGAKISVGYDEIEGWEFSNDEKIAYTSHLDQLRNKAPYDVVLMYNTLDNINDPTVVLSNIKKMLSERGRLYIRCHPWCSRHGTDLYEKINKAYLHLILDPEELKRIGDYSYKKTNKILKPLQTYRKWFETTGFTIEQELPIEKEIEDFFTTDSVLMERIERHWGEMPSAYTSIEFVDYVLTPTESNHKIF